MKSQSRPTRLSRIALVASTLLAACVVGGEDTYQPPSFTGDPGQPSLDAVPVLRVIDGDTIEVEIDGVVERVRMKGVNTPELHPAPPEYLGPEAETYTRTHVGTEVELIPDATCDVLATCRDNFDRLLAYVRLVDGSDLGASLIAEGLASVYVYPCGDYCLDEFDRMCEYCALQTQASSAGLGIWSDPSSLQMGARTECARLTVCEGTQAGN